MVLHPTANERTWLAWLVKVRIIVITFLLGIELAVVNFTPAPIPTRLFISVIVLWYTIGAFYLLLSKLWREYSLQARLQVLTDLALAAAVLYASGGIDSPFTFLYPLIIITAAILLPRYWAYLTAALAFILSGAMLELTYFGALRSYSITRPDLKSLQASILINLLAYLAIAYLTSYLVAKLRRANVQLLEKSGALEQLQALHEDIIRSMSGGLITTDLEGRIEIVNPAGERLLERTQAELAGRRIGELFGAGLPRVGHARRELRYGGSASGEKTFGMTACALTGSDHEVAGRVYTFTDLTDVRRLEREVTVRDRMAAVGRLASGIAHEIRNPLAAIAGSAQMLQESPGLGDDERALLAIVHRESERLNGIVTDFLAYSRTRYRFVRLDLLPLLQETLLLLENRPECAPGKVRLVRDFAVAEAPAEADGDRMRQVFWNLCDNALRAMPQGGVLTASLTGNAQYWEIAIADTGQGISPPVLENIFEPFHSSFAGGNGLGLAIVYQIMQAHEGKISVQSSPETGTRFTLQVKKAAVSASLSKYDGLGPEMTPHWDALPPEPGRAPQPAGGIARG
jgi:two-component system sensor histidine kinase PilS (NtrC family)